MSALAVDIVLLPSDDLLDRVIAFNRALQGAAPSPIVLNRIDCLPHVSLAMGGVTEDIIPAVANALVGIGSAHPPIGLTVTGVSVRSSRTGELVSSLDLDASPALQALHEAVIHATAPLVTRQAAPEMFVDPTAVTASTLGWVNEYRTAASFGRFWPHITLGMGTLPEDLLLPAPTRTSRLALCHLGAHCTCRRILFETALQGR